jgi:hypothetical protein
MQWSNDFAGRGITCVKGSGVFESLGEVDFGKAIGLSSSAPLRCTMQETC